MDLIGNAQLLEYKALMRDAHDTFETKPIIWQRSLVRIDRFGEDIPNTLSNVTLNVHLNYNYMRSWPINVQTESGELDRQSIQMLINKEYLGELGHINAQGYFDYNPDFDRFIIDGLLYKPVGDTAAAQAGPIDIPVVIILRREETLTGDNR